MKSLLPLRRKAAAQLLPVADDLIQSQDRLLHLPVELLLLILEHFSTVADILSLLNVCRAWRSVALLPDIWPSLAERCVPGSLAHIRASYSSEAQAKAFHMSLHQTHLHDRGYFNDITHHTLRLNLNHNDYFTLSKSVPVSQGGVHSLDTVVGLDPAAEGEHVSRLKLYSHGRIAWWPEAWHLPYFAVVDDVRTRVRRMYIYPGQHSLDSNDHRGWKTAMGELLFIMGRENLGVCVWHLERNEMREIKLPGSFDRCVVQGERLLFVSKRLGEVWTWSWDSNAIDTIDVAGQGCYSPGPIVMGGQVILGSPRPAARVGLRLRDTDLKLDFILHPTNPDVLFAITFDDVDLVVYEFASGLLTARIPLPHEHAAYKLLQRSHHVNQTVRYLRHQRCDAHGGYCLMTALIDGCRAEGGMPETSGLGSVSFNVYTKQFAGFMHHAGYARTPDTYLWNGLLAVPIDAQRHGADSITLSQRRPFVAMLRPSDGSAAILLTDGDSLPERTKDTSQPRPTLVWVPDEMQARPSFVQGVAYALAAKNRGWCELAAYNYAARGLDILDAEWLDGDEKTLIYVIGKEYTVWTFGDEEFTKTRDEKKVGGTWRERWKSVTGRARGDSRNRS